MLAEVALILAEVGLGTWIAPLPFKLPRFPRELWELVGRLVDILRFSEADFRWLYANSLSDRENIDAVVSGTLYKFVPLSAGDVDGVDALIAVIRLFVGIAEFIGKHPPDHVIMAIAELAA